MTFDVEGRRRKAAKIIALLDRAHSLAGAKVLEIGTGTGVIPAEVAERVGPAGRVVSVDTVDTRLLRDGYDFVRVGGVRLPFAGKAFDVVISNHAIEHVGGPETQQLHLDEISRVLRPDGVGYLATPGRWALLEPHFRVPLLSWWPRAMRSRVLRATRRGSVFDVYPLSRGEMESAIRRAGLIPQDMTAGALAELARIGDTAMPRSLVFAGPGWLVRIARPVIPTMVYLLRRPQGDYGP
jgi:SAM-dependent methyltransferase